jgi:hypothetical protein
VTWIDRDYKSYNKIFYDNPQGAPENALVKAKKFAKKLNDDDAKDKYGLYRDVSVNLIKSTMNEDQLNEMSFTKAEIDNHISTLQNKLKNASGSKADEIKNQIELYTKKRELLNESKEDLSKVKAIKDNPDLMTSKPNNWNEVKKISLKTLSPELKKEIKSLTTFQSYELYDHDPKILDTYTNAPEETVFILVHKGKKYLVNNEGDDYNRYVGQLS